MINNLIIAKPKDTFTIGGKPCLKGFSIIFENKPLFNIPIGTKLSRIGCYTSSSYRDLCFKTYVTYVGMYNSYAALRIPDDQIKGFSVFNPPLPVYLLIIPDYKNHVIYFQDFKYLRTDVLKPIFTIYE